MKFFSGGCFPENRYWQKSKEERNEGYYRERLKSREEENNNRSLLKTHDILFITLHWVSVKWQCQM